MNEKTQKIKQIVNDSKTQEECVEKLRKENLLFSLSEGRRYWNSLKKVENKKE